MLFRGCRMCANEQHLETCDFGADLRQLPLAGIAPKRAHGPKRVGGVDPGGLWGFLHLGLDVWVDLRGRGRQLSACHGSPPPRVLPPAESGQYVSSSWCQNGLSSLRDRPENRIPRFTGAARGRRGSVSLPAASRGAQTHWGAQQLVSWLSSAPPSLMETWGPRACARSTRRHDVTSSARPTQTGSPAGYITAMVKRNDQRFLLIRPTCHPVIHLHHLVYIVMVPDDRPSCPKIITVHLIVIVLTTHTNHQNDKMPHTNEQMV